MPMACGEGIKVTEAVQVVPGVSESNKDVFEQVLTRDIQSPLAPVSRKKTLARPALLSLDLYSVVWGVGGDFTVSMTTFLPRLSTIEIHEHY